MAERKNDTLKKARKEIDYLTGNDAVRRLADLREKWEMDYVTGIECAEKKGISKGREEGRKQGEKENKRKIAKKLLEMGMEITKISEVTGLSDEEIRKL